MGNLMKGTRGNWSSKFGFLMAAVGSAVGLGNIWRFPYIVGQHGGALFLIVYLLIMLLLGFPMVSLELSVGRHKQASVINGMFERENKKKSNWSFIGWITIITCFLIVSYYSVIGGWLIKYLGGYVTGGGFVSSGDTSGIFKSFITGKWQPIIFNLVFLSLCILVLAFGIKKGIEKVSKFLMPALFVMLVFVAICSLTMDGAVEGLKYMFIPDFSQVNTPAKLFALFEAAMGQAFFSLSIGMGITLTYGSYLKKESNIPRDSLIICGFDSIVAIVAGLAVLPAVFSAGIAPNEGTGLLFISLPKVFASLGIFGNILATVFFLLVLFAALTSAISILEVLVSSLHEKFPKLSRVAATLFVGGVILISSTLVSLSQSKIFVVDLLQLFDQMTVKVLLPVTAILVCVFTSVIWKTNNASRELTFDKTSGEMIKPKTWVKWWEADIKFISPLLIAIILVAGLFTINWQSFIF